MKCLFTHDFPMIIDHKQKNVYSIGGFPYTVWERYLKHFSSLKVIGRVKDLEINSSFLEEKKYSKSSGPGVSFKGVPNLSSLKGLLINKRKAERIIKEEMEKVDFVIARLPSEVGSLAVKVAEKIGKPYLIELVGCPYDGLKFHGSLKSKLYAPVSRAKTKKIVKNSKYTIYVTKDYLQKKYPTKGLEVSVSNVSLKETSQDVLISRKKKITDMNKKKIIIGLIGSLDSKYKGIDLAIEYLGQLKGMIPEFELHILGNGEKGNFDKVIEKNNMRNHVFFDGVKSSGYEVYNWIDQLDIYIQPSLTEGLPRALIEAMSRGCPTIASKVGGIPELLSNEFLFNPNSSEEFSASLQKIIPMEIQLEQAYENFHTANKYSSHILSLKREEFISKILKNIV